MISSLKGEITLKKGDSVVLDVNGVGYQLAIPEPELSSLKVGQKLLFYTYLSVKEDALNLYGSQEKKIIDWFIMLLAVKGIGPKSALGVMAKAGSKDLATAIKSESVDILKNLGINAKISERIVLELKNKAAVLAEGETIDEKEINLDSEVLQALENLGYSKEQARGALQQAEGGDVQSKIKSSLKILGG